MIETKDGRYIKIVEVKPLNFLMRTPLEQDVIIQTLAGWFKISPVKVQIKTITKRADINKHLESVSKDLKKERNPMCKAVGNAYLTLVQTIKEQQALSRRFFIIFSYEGVGGYKTEDIHEIASTLDSAVATLRTKFEQCGNEVVTFTGVEQENTFLTDVLYTFYNRKSSIYETLQQRVRKVQNDYLDMAKLIPGKKEIDIPIADYIAPRGVDFTHRNYIIMDGMYYSMLYITTNGYPTATGAGWTSMLVNAGDGIDVDIHLERMPRSKIVDDVNRKIRLNKISIKSIGDDTQENYEHLVNSIQSGYFVKNELSKGEELFYMSIMITISARTLTDLDWKKRQIVEQLKSRDIETRECTWQMENALQSVTPLLSINKNIWRKSKRNIMNTSVAALYPFTAYEMCDDNGILLGVNKQNRSLTILDLFNTKLHSNANQFIVGSSGKGKTFTLLVMAIRMRMRGIQTFLLAPIKGEEFKRVCAALGGAYVKISPASNDCINIMEIRNPDRSMEMLISGEDIGREPLLMKKIDQLNVFFSLLIPDMSYEEQQIMDEALMDTYRDRGITSDNDSLYEDTDKNVMKPMPTLGDLYITLTNKTRGERLATIVKRFVTGSAQAFNGQTNVDLNNKFIVLDMSDLSKTMKSIGMFIALDYVWDKARSNRTERKSIIIDEVWQLIGANSSPLAASFVMDLYKLIRSSGGSVISATQDLGDFFALEDGKFGRAIINNSATNIVLGLKPQEAEKIAQSMKLSPMELKAITSAQTGEALIISSGGKVTVNVIASDTEKELITTNREDLIRIAEKNKAQIAE